jgi:hypothetical protein
MYFDNINVTKDGKTELKERYSLLRGETISQG